MRAGQDVVETGRISPLPAATLRIRPRMVVKNGTLPARDTVAGAPRKASKFDLALEAQIKNSKR